MDADYKFQIKTNGLNHIRKLEQDKCQDAEDILRRREALQKEEMKLKRTCYGRLDPTHMDFNLPEIPGQQPNSDGISLDPEDITFNFKT